MLWFDLGTPKSVLFFKPLIDRLKAKGEAPLVTSRGGRLYEELSKLVRLHALDAVSVGEYGGDTLAGKLDASLARQARLLDLVTGEPISGLISLCNVDSCRVAFGLGLPVINFCDLPTAADRETLTPVARLTLPLSTRVLHPFVVPGSIFTRFLGPEAVIRYDFLDPILYLKDQTPDRSLIQHLPLDPDRDTVCFREEEHMASYVRETRAWVVRALRGLDANLMVIPRYGGEGIRRLLPEAVVVDSGAELSAVLPFVDLMVGGGGTINIEAAYWGTPVISTRSFLSHYDRYLLEHGLMHHARSAEEFGELYETMVGRRMDSSKLREQERSADVDSLLESVGI
jgi:predicted glycosyltransferase